MQICPKLSAAVQTVPVGLDPAFPIVAFAPEMADHPAEELHEHPVWEVGFCLAGSGVFYIGEDVFSYAAGAVSVIPPGIEHMSQSDADVISRWNYIYIDLEGMLRDMPPDCAALAICGYAGVLQTEELPMLAPLVLVLLDELHHKRPYSQVYIRMKVAELALHLHRLTKPHGMFTALPDSLDEISPAVLYIVNHYQENITLAELAAMCSKSVTSFRRGFLQAVHKSPFEFLYNVRIKAAINLLQTTNLPVSDVASRVGYQSLSSFNRHFRRIAGMSPLNCRKQRNAVHES